VLGTKSSEGKSGQTKDKKSFSINLSVEGFFELSGKAVLDANDLSNQPCMTAALQQLHVLSMDRVRTIAAELGYKGVRPDLGMSTFELQVEVEKLN
jgi:hypothetical protein